MNFHGVDGGKPEGRARKLLEVDHIGIICPQGVTTGLPRSKRDSFFASFSRSGRGFQIPGCREARANAREDRMDRVQSVVGLSG